MEGLGGRLGPRPRPAAQARPVCGEGERALARPRASGCARPASSVGPRAFSCELPLRACFGLESCGADLGSGSRVCCPAAGNNIGDAGATALAAALQKNTTLTKVDLGGARACPCGCGGWSGFGDAWAHGRGPPRRLAQCAGKERARAFARSRASGCAHPASSVGPRTFSCELPLRACFGLESCGADLGLGSRVCCPAAANGIGADGWTALAAALQKNTTVTTVNFHCARACPCGCGGWSGFGGRLGPRPRPGAQARPMCGEGESEPLRGGTPRAARTLQAASGPARSRASFPCARASAWNRVALTWARGRGCAAPPQATTSAPPV
jgi:hypothetical protein